MPEPKHFSHSENSFEISVWDDSCIHIVSTDDDTVTIDGHSIFIDAKVFIEDGTPVITGNNSKFKFKGVSYDHERITPLLIDRIMNVSTSFYENHSDFIKNGSIEMLKATLLSISSEISSLEELVSDAKKRQSAISDRIISLEDSASTPTIKF